MFYILWNGIVTLTHFLSLLITAPPSLCPAAMYTPASIFALTTQQGQPIDVRPAKIVSGLEPENTNVFLISLATCASDPNYDSNAAIDRCRGGEMAGSGPPCVKRGAPTLADAAGAFGPGDQAESKGGDFGDGPGGGSKGSPAKGGPGDIGQDDERGKSRGGTRGGKPTRQSGDVGLGGITSGGVPPANLDLEVEKCDGSIEFTQRLLGDVIQKPKLSEKLLSKPPFRFLYDIVMEVRRVSGFAAGLYSTAEDDVTNIGDKAAKLQYLEKIIKLVGVQLNTIVEAKPVKIVAGLDAPITNNFLQLLAVCAKHNPNSAAAVRTVLDQMGVAGGDIPREEVTQRSPPPRDNAEPKGHENENNEPVRQEIGGSSKGIESERREIGASSKASVGDDEDGDAKRTGRPTTARRRPPKVKDGAKEVDKHASPVKKAEGIMADGADDADDDIVDETDQRLADDMRAGDKKSGGSAAGNNTDPESKLVRDILGRQAEQEAARNPNASNRSDDDAKASEEPSGGGIRLGRLRKTGVDAKKGGYSDVPTLGEGDLERLRGSIQTLVQHTGPLGGCLDYIQEDIGLMTSELRKWEDECRKYETKFEREQAKTVEILFPFKSQLQEIEAQITERIALISSAKANIARNEDRLVSLLKLVSTS